MARMTFKLADITKATNYNPLSDNARDGASIIDGFIINNGVNKGVTKRPGYTTVLTSSEASSVIFSPYVGIEGTRYWVQANNKLWIDGNTSKNVTNLFLNNGVSWAEDETYLYIQGGSGAAANSDYVYNKTSGVLTEITDADHPINASLKSPPGVVFIDGYFCVVGSTATESRIYNSDLGDPTAWTATNYIAAALEPDKIQYLAKHHNHVVAFGSSSIEFFYNQGNLLGSPLGRRNDIFYKIGLSQINESAVANDKSMVAALGDDLYFIGRNDTQSIGIYLLREFKVSKISTPAIELLLTYVDDSTNAAIKGIVTYGNRNFLVVMDSYANSYSLIYDIQEEVWYKWNIAYYRGTTKGYTAFGTSNGTLYSIGTLADAGENPTFTIITPRIMQIADYPRNTIGLLKQFIELSLVADKPGSTTSFNISWTDDDYQNYSTARTLDINTYNKLSKLGLSRERAFKLTYSGANNCVLYFLNLDIEPLSN